MTLTITSGSPVRLGAVADAGGVNFAVFSAHASRIDLCLFDQNGREERLTLPGRCGDVWHGRVEGIGPGQLYGLRADGPWAPSDGHLFNPAKLLIDPYARQLDRRIVWDALMTGHTGAPPLAGGQRCDKDSAPVVPRAIVMADRQAMPPAAAGRPGLLYEGHVKGLTMQHPEVAEALRGTYRGLSDPALVAHMKKLGVTHLELLPITALLDDRHVIERGLVNYWGYQPMAMMAADPRYGDSAPAALAAEFARLRTEGIAVILDVVYNHSGEGDENGPTLSFRGLDNKSYYMLAPGGQAMNYTGTGNTLNVAHPAVLRLVLDALRHWASLGVAGFRFDLAPSLLRGAGGFDPGSAFLAAVAQDPVLNRLLMIAEPWDLGPDGYRLGRFPAPFLEWNDLFRDEIRRYWRGDRSQAELARRLTGSAELFDRPGRSADASVNFLASHDGFTLQDVVSYREKHNIANGEQNRDGHHDNCSDNMGTEGAAAAPIEEARIRRKRAMLATLFLAQGTPMLLAGDEMGRTQQGNNNAYAIDGPLNWIDWAGADRDLIDYVSRLAALRRDHPVLRQERFLHGEPCPSGGRNLVWLLPDGSEPRPEDWETRSNWPLGYEIGQCTPGARPERMLAVLNANGDDAVTLPEGRWIWLLDSAAPAWPDTEVSGRVSIPAQSVQIFIRPTTPLHEEHPNHA